MRICYQSKRRKGNSLSFQGLETVQMAFNCPFMRDIRGEGGVRGRSWKWVLFQFKKEGFQFYYVHLPVKVDELPNSQLCFTKVQEKLFRAWWIWLYLLVFFTEIASNFSVRDTQIYTHLDIFFLTILTLWIYTKNAFQSTVHFSNQRKKQVVLP